MILFELQEHVARNERLHMLALVFDPSRRRLFPSWENLARRLMSDFQYHTSRITHSPEYKTLWRQLRKYYQSSDASLPQSTSEVDHLPLLCSVCSIASLAVLHCVPLQLFLPV